MKPGWSGTSCALRYQHTFTRRQDREKKETKRPHFDQWWTERHLFESTKGLAVRQGEEGRHMCSEEGKQTREMQR